MDFNVGVKNATGSIEKCISKLLQVKKPDEEPVERQFLMLTWFNLEIR